VKKTSTFPLDGTDSCLDITNVARNHVTKRPQFAEKPAGHCKRLKKSWEKHPPFAKQAAGHHKCPKIMQQNVHISLKSWLDITSVFKNSCEKTSTCH
jgi:hypothetical protein